MATTTSITTTYAGEFAQKYIAAALLSANTLDKNLINIKPNIKYKSVVKKAATSGIVKDATCDFTDVGTVTLTERILEPEQFQVNVELCKLDFDSDWEAAQMGYSADDELPPLFSDFIIGEVAAQVAQATEQSIWAGTGSTSGQFEGFEALLNADATVVDVSGSIISATNVIAELGKVVDAVSQSVASQPDMIIYVADNVARSYRRALGALGYVDAYGEIDGFTLEVAQGMTANKMVAGQKSNLWFGTGLMSDYNEVKVLDMADLDGSKNVRIVMRYTAGVQYGIGSEIVYYS